MTFKKWISAFGKALEKDGFEVKGYEKGKNHVKVIVSHTASSCTSQYVVASTVNHGGAMTKALSGAKHSVIAQKEQYDSGSRPAPKSYKSSVSITL